ncbi:unnamed protein product [Larinioides sclopetarius]|uniref:Uncharacterized protein n=1 Tax=Larinioides sclopetarius TaxID=280406 RepID=A0AAV1Z6P5_9ARAC
MDNNKRKPTLNDLGDQGRLVKRRRYDNEEVRRRVALDIKAYLDDLNQPAPGGEQLEEAIPDPPAVPSPPPRALDGPAQRRRPDLDPSKSSPGPPQDDAEMDKRTRD